YPGLGRNRVSSASVSFRGTRRVPTLVLAGGTALVEPIDDQLRDHLTTATGAEQKSAHKGGTPWRPLRPSPTCAAWRTIRPLAAYWPACSPPRCAGRSTRREPLPGRSLPVPTVSRTATGWAAATLPSRRPTPWPNRGAARDQDRKSTRLNSSHAKSSYAVFCLK